MTLDSFALYSLHDPEKEPSDLIEESIHRAREKTMFTSILIPASHNEDSSLLTLSQMWMAMKMHDTFER